MNMPRPVAVFAWCVAAAAAAKVEAAAFQLFVAITIFIIIARNLGERRNGLSAYSVFNPGHEALLGQIRAEQFDAEIRHLPTETGLDSRDADSHSTGVGLRNSHEDVLESVRREIWHEAQRTKRSRAPKSSRWHG